MTTTSNLFPNIIGQHPTKRKFEFYIKAFERIGIVPNIMITAPKGAGKTYVGEGIRPKPRPSQHNGAETLH